MDSHSPTSHITLSPMSNASFKLSWPYLALHQIRRLGQAILDYVIQGDEPKIYQQIHRNGEILWTIYDPCSNHHITCSSETEVRFWLEQRYRG
jgi:hypothetical protein